MFEDIKARRNVEYVVIERQVPSALENMCMMYAIDALAHSIFGLATDEVVIFDPKLKFTRLGLPCSNDYRTHKDDSVNICRAIFKGSSNTSALLDAFNVYDKKDDVADSFNQAFNWLIEMKKIDFSFQRIRSLLPKD
jgi:hypothetical protein